MTEPSAIVQGHKPNDTDRELAGRCLVTLAKHTLALADVLDRHGGAPEHLVAGFIPLLVSCAKDGKCDKQLVLDALSTQWDRTLEADVGTGGRDVELVLEDLCFDKAVADAAEDAGG
jgi:hypothetical protein